MTWNVLASRLLNSCFTSFQQPERGMDDFNGFIRGGGGGF